MNTSIISKEQVSDTVLDALGKELPVIIAGVLDVPGGNLARLKPEQISLAFSRASSRDTGADIRILAFAKSNAPRKSTENDRANAIREKVAALVATCGEPHTVAVRIYLMEVGAAEG